MTAKNVFILAGLTVLSVFAVSAVWEFGLEDLAFQSPASDETSESDAERWRDILAATLAAAIASILPGFITLRSIAQRQIFERALVDSSQRFRDFAESSSDWF